MCGELTFESLPDDIVNYLLEEYLRGSLIKLRVISQQFNKLVLRAIALCGHLRTTALPLNRLMHYHGSIRILFPPVSL